jgi:hypothetical protein
MRRLLPDYGQFTRGRRPLLRRQAQTLLREDLEGRGVHDIAGNEGQRRRGFCMLLHAVLRQDPNHSPGFLSLCTFSLQIDVFRGWAMLGFEPATSAE